MSGGSNRGRGECASGGISKEGRFHLDFGLASLNLLRTKRHQVAQNKVLHWGANNRTNPIFESVNSNYMHLHVLFVVGRLHILIDWIWSITNQLACIMTWRAVCVLGFLWVPLCCWTSIFFVLFLKNFFFPFPRCKTQNLRFLQQRSFSSNANSNAPQSLILRSCKPHNVESYSKESARMGWGTNEHYTYPLFSSQNLDSSSQQQ